VHEHVGVYKVGEVYKKQVVLTSKQPFGHLSEANRGGDYWPYKDALSLPASNLETKMACGARPRRREVRETFGKLVVKTNGLWLNPDP
jgi:hypothetical protein